MNCAYQTIDELWYDNLKGLLRTGHELGSRDGECRETLAVAFQLENVTHNWLWSKRRKLSATYAAAELLWCLSGSRDGTRIKHYAPGYGRWLEDDGTAFGAYGERFKRHHQLQAVVNLLRRRPNTRQAVITAWHPTELSFTEQHSDSKLDIPCTLSLQFLNRGGYLCTIGTMRSNDVWLGMPNDIWCFTSLAKIIAAILGLEPLWYAHRIGSMHLYAKHDKAAIEAVPCFGCSPRDDTFKRTGTGVWSDVDVAIDVEELTRTRLLLEPAYQKLMTSLGPGLLGECAGLCAIHNGYPEPKWWGPDQRILHPLPGRRDDNS